MSEQSGALEALTKLAEQLEHENGVVRVPMPRDFVYCQWCKGKGCAACFNSREKLKAELDAEYARQFPDGPKPIMTAHLDNPEEMAALKRVFHREKIEQAFGPGGRGMDEIMENIAKEKNGGVT